MHDTKERNSTRTCVVRTMDGNGKIAPDATFRSFTLDHFLGVTVVGVHYGSGFRVRASAVWAPALLCCRRGRPPIRTTVCCVRASRVLAGPAGHVHVLAPARRRCTVNKYYCKCYLAHRLRLKLYILAALHLRGAPHPPGGGSNRDLKRLSGQFNHLLPHNHLLHRTPASGTHVARAHPRRRGGLGAHLLYFTCSLVYCLTQTASQG